MEFPSSSVMITWKIQSMLRIGNSNKVKLLDCYSFDHFFMFSNILIVWKTQRGTKQALKTIQLCPTKINACYYSTLLLPRETDI